MQYPFANPISNALRSRHRSLALFNGLASKYLSDIAPFAAVEESSQAAFAHLHAILEPGEHTWLFQLPTPEAIGNTGLTHETSLPCLQMLFPETAPLPGTESDAEVLALDESHAAEMVALTDVAFPGFFRLRTCLMGSYFGIRDDAGQLVAMCGERIVCAALDGTEWREISGLCTHPEHRGKGYGVLLLRRLIEVQRAMDAVSVLHVASSNSNAIELYHRLGFLNLREPILHKVVRTV